MLGWPVLSVTTFLPLVGALFLLVLRGEDEAVKRNAKELLVLTGELSDGWIGNSFLPESATVFFDPIREGAAKAGRSFDELMSVRVRS